MKIAVTGHRPPRLLYQEDKICRWLKHELKKLDDVEMAYCGMAQGADQLFAKVCIKMGIPLYCAYPYKKNKFHPDEQAIIDKAAEVDFLADEYSKKCYFLRDKFMVDNCDVLYAIWDGQKNGGTWLTIQYAQKIGKPIIFCNVRKDY